MRIALPFTEIRRNRRRQARAWASKKTFACAYFAAALFLGVGRVEAQTAELDTIASAVHQGRFKEAESQLQRYLQARPRSARANHLLGTVYLKEGRFEQAAAVLQKAVTEAPKSLEPRVSLGDTYLADGKLDAALEAYQGAAKIAPSDPRVDLALARLYLGKGEFAKSLTAAGSIPINKRTDALLPTLAADYFGLHQPEKAAVEIQAMLDVAHQHEGLLPELVEFFLSHRDFQSARQLLDVAGGKQPVTDRWQVDLALTQAGLGQLDAAQVTLEGVLEHKPDSVEALAAAGQVASLQLNWPAAAEAFGRALSLAPDRPDLLYGLISAQLYGNQPEAALKHAEHLYSLVPEDPRSSYVLALSLFGVNRGTEAKSYAKQALAAHPLDREMHLILADVALNDERDVVAAHKEVNVCLKQNPNDPGALYYLGMAERMEGDVHGAIESLSRSVAANSKNAATQAALGGLCLQVGDVPRAIAALEQALLLAKDEPQNHYQLALAYSRAGLTDKANTQLKLYQELKSKQEQQAKELKGPSVSEVPHMGIPARP